MARALADIEKEIRELASGEQVQLLRALLEELDGPADADVERAWLAEVQRRSRELDEGKIQTVPGDEVFARLRSDRKR